jgi:hypothetical protein
LRGHNDVPCGVSVAMKVTEAQNPHEPRFPFISGSASR